MLPPTDSISSGDLFGGPAGGALEQHFGHQLGQAVVFQRLGQHAALEDGADFHEGQAVIFLDQEAQAVGQNDFLDGILGNGGGRRGGFGRGAGGQEGVEGAAGGVKYSRATRCKPAGVTRLTAAR